MDGNYIVEPFTGRRIWVTQYILITEESHQETETRLRSRIIFSQEFIIIRDLSAPLISLTVHIPPSQQPGAPGLICRDIVAMLRCRGSGARVLMLTRVTRGGMRREAEWANLNENHDSSSIAVISRERRGIL